MSFLVAHNAHLLILFIKNRDPNRSDIFIIFVECGYSVKIFNIFAIPFEENHTTSYFSARLANSSTTFSSTTTCNNSLISAWHSSGKSSNWYIFYWYTAESQYPSIYWMETKPKSAHHSQKSSDITCAHQYCYCDWHHKHHKAHKTTWVSVRSNSITTKR